MSGGWMFLTGALLGLVTGASLGVMIAGLLLQEREPDDMDILEPSLGDKDSRGFWLGAVVVASIMVGWVFHVLGMVP